MNAAQRELLRGALLIALEASGNYRPAVATLRIGVRQSGHNVTEEEVKAELQYLIDAGMVAREEKKISPENSGYRITKAGRDHLALEGLA